MLLLGGLGHAPRKILKLCLQRMNLEVVLMEKHEAVQLMVVASHLIHPLDQSLKIINNICDWILENRPNCHTGPIPFYWPSEWLHSNTTHSHCHYQAWLTDLLF